MPTWIRFIEDLSGFFRKITGPDEPTGMGSTPGRN